MTTRKFAWDPGQRVWAEGHLPGIGFVSRPAVVLEGTSADEKTVKCVSDEGWELAQANPQGIGSVAAAEVTAYPVEILRTKEPTDVVTVVTAPAVPLSPADARAAEADLNQAVGVPSSDATGDPDACIVDESSRDRRP